MKVRNNREFIQKNVKNYIRLGGTGILDGLKQPKSKNNFYKILGFNDDGKLLIKRYRSKKVSYLPYWNQDQDFEIINQNDYKKLPLY